jgi:V/A-type H+-transporting ATPase subunit K
MNPAVRRPNWPLILAAIAAALALAGLLLWSLPVLGAEPAHPVLAGEATGWGLFSAALATGLSSLGAGFAVARLGTAAVGALAEKPELLGRLLILVGLAEGIAIYGVIISILILQRLS